MFGDGGGLVRDFRELERPKAIKQLERNHKKGVEYMNVTDLLTHFKNVKQIGSEQYQASCPAHADDKPSLSIKDTDDKFLLDCKAGCSVDSVMESIGLSMKDLFKDNDTNGYKQSQKPKSDNIRAIYKYIDLDGNVMFEKVRFKTGNTKGVFRHMDSNGKIIWSISKGTYYETYKGSGEYAGKKDTNKNNDVIKIDKDIERILYNLPALTKAIEEKETVYICEGEKDVETLKDWGLVGTCNFDGGGKDKFKKRYSKFFLNSDVVVIPDCDKAGEDHQQTIKSNLFDYVKSMKVLELPNVKGKKGFDLTDYVEIGHTKDDFMDLVEGTEKEHKKSADSLDETSDTKHGVFSYNGCYARHTKNGVKYLTNFIISLKEVIVNGEIMQFGTTINTCKGKKIEKLFDDVSFISKRDFLRSAGGYCSFYGNDNDLMEIKDIMLTQDYRELIGVDYIGFNKVNDTNVFITNTKAINEELNVIDDIVITDDKTVIKSSILEVEPINKDELIELSPYLFNFNKLEITSSIMGTIVTMMIKERLKEFNIKTQHLMLFGEAGAGKSQTLENIIAPFFSYESSIVSSAGMTRFTSIKNITSSNTIPLLLEEYKPSEMNDKQKDMLLELFRNIYDEHSEQRGNRDQTITDYPLLSPIVAVGEEQVEQTAVIERSIITSFSKMESEKDGRESNYLKIREMNNLMQKLGRSMLNIALQITDEELKETIDQSEILTSEIFKGRVKQNVTNTITGISLIVKLYEQLGLNIENETKVKVTDIVNAVNNNVFNENLEGTSHTKTITDNTLELIDTMVGRGKIVEGLNFTYVNKGTELALNIKSFFDDVTKYKSEFKVDTSIIGTQKQLTKMLRSTNYFIDYKAVKYIDQDDPSKKKTVRSYVLSIDKLKERDLDLDNLLSI